MNYFMLFVSFELYAHIQFISLLFCMLDFSFSKRSKYTCVRCLQVPQLFDMYLYCLVKGEPQVFYNLLYWAAEAYNNNGNMHIQRTFQAFIQKHLGSLHPWCVYYHVNYYPRNLSIYVVCDI